MIEVPNFLPLGSIVTLLGNAEKRLMVIGRALAVDNEEGAREYYDYALVMYPEGLLGDAAVYSNHDCIDQVYFHGFADSEDAALLAGVAEAVAGTDLPKARPQDKDTW